MAQRTRAVAKSARLRLFSTWKRRYEVLAEASCICCLGEIDTMEWLVRAGCLPVLVYTLSGVVLDAFAADSGSHKNAAADRVEQLYNRFPAGTDTEGAEGYNAAEKAAEQLRLDFLSSFQNPQKNAANQSAWEEEEAQLIGDSLKYGGDRTLDAAAMYWGMTHLVLPVMSPEELLAQAKTMQPTGQPGDQAFDERIASYLAARFDSLNKLASHYHSATDAIEGRGVPLNAADLQAALRIDDVDRTAGKPKMTN